VADAPSVRRARADDVPVLTPLLYLAASDMHDRMAGSRERALRVIAADLRRRTLDVTWVAEVGGRPAAAMVAYPYRDDPAHVRAFLRSLLPRTPPWRWPSIVRLHWRGHRRGPRHPVDCIYVEALSTEAAARRRGAGRALLGRAEDLAVAAGLRWLALETAAANEPALALYRSAGFRLSEETGDPAPAGAVRTVCLVKELR
jgi:ribosomal protein S18 acetylase RimI-like enzyme